MAKQKIVLGGIVKEEVAKINANFTEVYDGLADMPTKTSDLANDSGFVNTTAMNNAIEQAKEEIDVPTKVSDLTNDSGFQTAAQVNAATANKVDKIAGKDLSTNDYTNADKTKVANLGKVDFTASSFGTAQADGYFYATLPAAGKYPVKVMKSNGSKYEEVIVQASVEGDNIVLCSDSAFTGYVVTV